MNRGFVGCVAVALVLGVNAQKAVEMPTAAKQVVAKMEVSVIQAKRKAVTELTSVMNSETHAGRLDSAVAINAKIKELTAEIEGEKAEGKRGADFFPGTWRMQNGTLFTVEKGNKFSAAVGNFKWSGSWHVDSGKMIVDSSAFVDTYDLPAKRETRDGKSVWMLRGKNSKGEPVSLEKQE